MACKERQITMTANQDGRYPHFMRRPRDRAKPMRIICVDPFGTLKPERRNSHTLVEELVGWHVVELCREGDGLIQRGSYAGCTVDALWTMLACRMQHNGMVWLLSYQCSRAWSLLGLWGKLEYGFARISGTDRRNLSDRNRDNEPYSPGILIAEDPPCLAQLRLRGAHGSILWLDCRNWGIELDNTLSRGEETALALAALVVRLERYSMDYLSTPLAPTAAGQSYRTWRTAKLTHGVHCHVNPNALLLERQAHIGGRCECYRLGVINGQVFHLDIRSAYGSIMCKHMLPVGLERWHAIDCCGESIDAECATNMIADVTISTDEPAYPLRRDGDVIYPVGRFRTQLCRPELADAIR